MSLDSTDEIISEIYEAAAVPEYWPRVLGKMSKHVDGAGGILFTSVLDRIRWTASEDIYDAMDEFVREGWAAINPRPSRIMALNHAGFIQDLDAFTREELDRDPVYANFLRKRGLGWATGTMLSIPNGDALIFSFERAYEKGPVPRPVIEFFDRLRPHLARGALLSARLGLERAQAMTDALQAIGLPAAVLRPRGALLVANAAFERWMPTLFRDHRDRIRLSDAAADALIAKAIARIGLANEPGVVNSVPVAAGEGRPPMILHLLPVRGVANDIFTRADSLLVVTPVDRASVPTAEVLQGLFDLTPAEARVARGIGEATSVEDLAAALGVSRETVRTQIKAVLAKTGVGGQKELVSLLAGKVLRPDQG
jgi:DNA-binding CsgD family transcriptional regulator